MATTWNVAFESKPAGTGRSPSYGDDDIRELKTAIRERFAKEHVLTTGSGTESNHGFHLQGSALPYYTAATPTLLPDGVTTLSSGSKSKGRIWVDPSSINVRYWNGTSFSGITREVTRISIQGTLAVGTNVVPPIGFTRTVKVLRVAMRVLSAPTGAALKVSLKKNGTLTIFNGTNASIAAGATYRLLTVGNFTNGYLSITPNTWLGFNIAQVGSTLPGSNFAMTIEVEMK